MSRFADPQAVRRLDLGPCECPGTPHEDGDYATIRTQVSTVELSRVAGANTGDMADMVVALAPLVVGWNLLGPDGLDWPPSPDTILSLQAPTLAVITEALGDVLTGAGAAPPNPSGARSAASSQASASRTPRRQRTPTT